MFLGLKILLPIIYQFLKLKNSGIPLVFFNLVYDEVEADKIIIDNFKATYDATTYLIAIAVKILHLLVAPTYFK